MDTPFDIRTLYKAQVNRTDHRQATYDILVRRVHHRVKTVSQSNEVQCVYQLPQLVVGMPLYDPFECCGYLIRKLKNDGFMVKYYHPNILYINWAQHVIESHVRGLDATEAARKKEADLKFRQDVRSGGLHVPATGGLTSYIPTGRLFA
jgi:hypothetical protein